jgi:cation transporter-like permease
MPSVLFFQRLPSSPRRRESGSSPNHACALNLLTLRQPLSSNLTASTSSSATKTKNDHHLSLSPAIDTTHEQLGASSNPPASTGNWLFTSLFGCQEDQQRTRVKYGHIDDDDKCDFEDDPKSWDDIEKLTEQKYRQVKRSWSDLKGKKPYRKFAGEAFLALLIAMVGLGFAGVVLDSVKHLNVFVTVSELFILVPVILNLKGNLELNLATRLSLASNSKTLSLRLVLGNVALMQVQAIIAGVVAGLWVYLMGGLAKGGNFDSAKDTSLVISVAIISSSVSSMLSTLLMSLIVFSCQSCGIDPDNFGK